MANDERRNSFDIGARADTAPVYTSSVHSPFIEARKVKVEEVKKTDADEFADIEEQFLSEFMELMHDYVHTCVRSYPQGLTNQDKMHIARAMQRVIDQKMGDISSARARLNWKKVRIDSTLNATANDLFSQVVIEFSKKIHDLFVRYFTFEDDYSMNEKKGISDAVYRALKDFHEEILFDVVHDIDVSFAQDSTEDRSFDIVREEPVDTRPSQILAPVHVVEESKQQSVYVAPEPQPIKESEPEYVPEQTPIITELVAPVEQTTTETPPAEEEVREIHPTDTSDEEVSVAEEEAAELVTEPRHVHEVPVQEAHEEEFIETVAPTVPSEAKREAPVSRYVTDIAPKALPVLTKLPEKVSTKVETAWDTQSSSEWETKAPAQHSGTSVSIGSLKARAGSEIGRAHV